MGLNSTADKAAFHPKLGADTPNPELLGGLGLQVRSRVTAHSEPRETSFANDLPKNFVGKALRLPWRQHEVRLPRARSRDDR